MLACPGDSAGRFAECRPAAPASGQVAALRWALWLAAESRLWVRQQQRRALPEEFAEGNFRMEVDLGSGDTREERVFLPEEQVR